MTFQSVTDTYADTYVLLRIEPGLVASRNYGTVMTHDYNSGNGYMEK